MPDAKLKVISNPYRRTVSFEAWDGGWAPVDEASAPSSMLLDDDMRKGFFPFKADAIVSTIVDEYWVEGERVHLVFEGTDDEYAELAAICELDKFRDAVHLDRSKRTLPSATHILPKIGDALGSLREVLSDSYPGSNGPYAELDRLSLDLVREIPVCVMGNYSSGKSTFINALIGREILPTGDEPITARVYQIKDSHDGSSASVEFEYGGERTMLAFSDAGLVQERCSASRDLLDAMRDALGNSASESLVSHMNAVLRRINSLDSVSDTIEIGIPFRRDGIWSGNHRFVIFDTPGSNSASNRDHLRVLRKAMRGFSDGLLVYVAEYSTLDSTDNASLFDEIATIDALDERFTMIVVNKADSADIRLSDFDESKKRLVLDWAVPKALYSQGIYFVSSVMGLGAKTSGDFISDSCAEKYEDQERKYLNPSSRFYKTLYRFNILPSQIMARTVRESESFENGVLANSGLLSIEREMEIFAERYSAYNKCQVAERAVGSTLEEMRQSLGREQARLRLVKDKREHALTEGAFDLAEKIDTCAMRISSDVTHRYALYAEKKTTCMRWLTSVSKLRKTHSESGISPKELLARIQSGFDLTVESMEETVIRNSQSFLKDEEKDARTKLCSVALSSSDLDEACRHKVTDLILEFPSVDVSSMTDMQFDLHEFEIIHKFLFFTFGSSGELDLQKLANVYNNEIRRVFKATVKLVSDAHRARFDAWLDQLCGMIKENIVDFNPRLRGQQEEIGLVTKRLGHLSKSLEAIGGCSDEISSLIGWVKAQ